MRDLNKKAKKDKTFTFDNVYDHSSTNEQVSTHYTVSVQGAITSVDGGGGYSLQFFTFAFPPNTG